MLKFVKEGRVVFTESDKGDLMFVDKEFERSFIEKASQVQEDTDTVMTTEQVFDLLKEAFASPVVTEETKAKIRLSWAKALAKATTEGIDTTSFVLE